MTFPEDVLLRLTTLLDPFKSELGFARDHFGTLTVIMPGMITLLNSFYFQKPASQNIPSFERKCPAI